MLFFSVLSAVAIIGGGLLSAIFAHRPTRVMMWTSAYLVLAVGVVQFGLVTGWQQLHLTASPLVIAGFVLYNIGSGMVVVGRWLKGKRAGLASIYVGSGLLAVSMLVIGGLALQAQASWTLGWFLALVLVILISMPIGVVLSMRRH